MHNKNYIAAGAGVEGCSDLGVLKNTRWPLEDAICEWVSFCSDLQVDGSQAETHFASWKMIPKV